MLQTVLCLLPMLLSIPRPIWREVNDDGKEDDYASILDDVKEDGII